jgi:hypothetical protein
MDNNGLSRHFHDVSRVGPIEFGAKQLRKIIINEHVGYSA